MVVLSVLSRQLWWFCLFLGDRNGVVICSKETDMMVLLVLSRPLGGYIYFRRQLSWCDLF